MKTNVMLTPSQAAEYLGVSPSTIYRMERKALISSIKTDAGQKRFSKETIRKYLKKGKPIKPSRSLVNDKRHEFLIRESKPLYTPEEKVKSGNLYFQTDSIQIYNADILKMDCLQEGIIDLIVTSPPYNVDIQYGSHDDKMTYEDYLNFTKEWLTKCYRLLKNDGRFCLNIPLDKNKGGQQSVCADITTIAKQVGWKYHSTII